jgi:hypothetical protein
VICPKFVRFEKFRLAGLEYGVNQFKFDGTGNADSVFPGSAFDSDFDAALFLIEKLRKAEPNIYINLTTGTYPSPFWTFYADSIWRGGLDDSETGVGPICEQWITYRDADTYQEIVQGGPLYPLNSLMMHGIIYAQYNRKLNTDPGNDFRNEVRSYFGSGTQCQELYITPSLLSSQNWDDVAEAARWSRENADVLRDTHWIGGNPAKLSKGSSVTDEAYRGQIVNSVANSQDPGSSWTDSARAQGVCCGRRCGVPVSLWFFFAV